MQGFPNGFPFAGAPVAAPATAPAQVPQGLPPNTPAAPPWAGGTPATPQFPPQGYTPPGYTPPNAAPAPGRFGAVENAEVISKSPLLGVGNFKLQIEEFKAVESKKPGKVGKLFLVVEFTILESDSTANPVSTKAAHVIDINGFGAGDAKAVIGASLGADPARPEQMDALAQRGAFASAAIEQICSPANPLRGRVVRARGWDKPVKAGPTPQNPRGVFTKIDYSAAAV